MIDVATREYNLTKDISHPNIIRMHNAFYNGLKQTTFIVMDYVEGISLAEYVRTVKPLPDNVVISIFRQLVSAVEYIHRRLNICHRDLNPNNILISGGDDPKVTIIDFNVAKRFLDPVDHNPLLMMTNTGQP